MDTAQKKEPEDGRLVQYLLTNPANDGGQWDMLVNIVGKSVSLMEPQLRPVKHGSVAGRGPFLRRLCKSRIRVYC